MKRPVPLLLGWAASKRLVRILTKDDDVIEGVLEEIDVSPKWFGNIIIRAGSTLILIRGPSIVYIQLVR